MLIPADVLARRFAKYAESYRAKSPSLPWWQRWQRGLFLGAWAAMKLESEALERLFAQGTETGTAETVGLGPKDDGPVGNADAPNPSQEPTP